MKRRRRLEPAKIRERVGGMTNWYLNIPMKKECHGCASGEPCPACKSRDPHSAPSPEKIVPPAASQDTGQREEGPF